MKDCLAGSQGGTEFLPTKLPCLKVLTTVNGLFSKDRADGHGDGFSPSLASCKPYSLPLLWQPCVARENGTTPLDRCPHHWVVLIPSKTFGLWPGFHFSAPPSKPSPSSWLHSTPPTPLLLIKKIEVIRQGLPICYFLPANRLGLLPCARHRRQRLQPRS